MIVSWTSDLDTGIEVIDNQHARILDYINQLAGNLDKLSVGHVLDELVDYTVSHFAFEESLQEEAGYKFAKPHKAVHDLFIKRVAKYQERHSVGDDIVSELHNMLRIWLINHIKRDDMAYVSLVKTTVLDIISDKEKRKDDGWIKRFFR